MQVVRKATPTDIATIEQIVECAYTKYVSRIGRKPGPMLDHYGARVAEGAVWVCEDERGIGGLVVLLDKPDHLLLDNIAVAPERQGEGLGSCLLRFAEAEARRRGHREIRLYTHVAMHENLAMYAKLGWEEYARGKQAGFSRVFMRRSLRS